MTRGWDAERRTDTDRATRLIRRAFPSLHASTVAPLDEGWDSTVFLVAGTDGIDEPDGTWVFRFPRRAVVLSGLRRELAVLPRIAEALPLAVPVPQFVADDGDDGDEPWPVVGSRLIPGRELAGAPLDDADRLPAATALGRFLRALHAPEQLDRVQIDLPHDPMQRAWPRHRLDDTRARLAALAAADLPVTDPAVDDLLDRAGRLDPPTGEPVLVHGDLHIRHLLVTDDGRAAGVIDWVDVCRADPAVDLAIAYLGFDRAARAALLDAYGPIDAERELRARAMAVRFAATLAGYARDVGRAALLAEALAGLRRAVS